MATPTLHRSPTMLQDELFGRQMNHVLVRFHAIAGTQSSDWLSLVSTVRDDELVHNAFKALICGLDSTTTASVRRNRCAEIVPAIRQRLSSSDATRCLNMIHLVLLLSYQELLVWNNPKAWMMHIWGMSTIVQTLGPHAFKSVLELRTYRLIRLFNVSEMQHVAVLSELLRYTDARSGTFERIPPPKVIPGRPRVVIRALVRRLCQRLTGPHRRHHGFHPWSTRRNRPYPRRRRHHKASARWFIASRRCIEHLATPEAITALRTITRQIRQPRKRRARTQRRNPMQCINCTGCRALSIDLAAAQSTRTGLHRPSTMVD
jgi:hypothetical protein